MKASLGGLNFGTLALSMIALFGGSFLASWILPMMPITLDGWAYGIFVGFFQMMILGLLGLTGKLSIWTIVIGGIIIFAGGMLGGFVATLFGLSGLFNTIVVLAIQVLVLSMMGYIKKGKTKLG